MKMKLMAVGMLAAVSLALSSVTATASEPSPGITDDTIFIGGSYPRSGPASIYSVLGDSVSAYFKHVNARGGVRMADGKTRKIEFVTYDDGYSPARLVENARRLVERDKVFAMFGTVGTPTTMAIVDYMNERGVPLVFVASGSSMFGNIEKYPWTIGWQPAMSTESAIYAEYLKRTKPRAKVAILMQNDDYGKEYVEAFKQSIKGSGIEIVAIETYGVKDPTVDSQVAKLAASGADTFLNISTPKAAAQSIKKKGQLGWKAEQLLNNISTSVASVLTPAGLDNATGIVTVGYMKEPTDPQWANSPDMIEYKKLAKQYGNLNVDNPLAVFGWSSAATLVHALENMKAPARKALMESVRGISGFVPPLLLPGISVHTAPKDGFLIETLRLQRFDGTQWKPFGEPYSFEARTPIMVH